MVNNGGKYLDHIIAADGPRQQYGTTERMMSLLFWATKESVVMILQQELKSGSSEVFHVKQLLFQL